MPFNQYSPQVLKGSLIFTFVLVLVCHAQIQESTGYGPPTFVPVERSTIAPVTLPPRNWIDQTQAQADAKSIGCRECHAGVESMQTGSGKL